MDFKTLSDTFGGCIFGENIRLDLQKADEEISRRNNVICSDHKSEDRAALALLKAVYHIARSDFTQASLNLVTIGDLKDSLPERWQIRREAYEIFLRGQRRYPGLLLFRQHGSEAAEKIADVEHNANVTAKKRMIELKQQMNQHAICAVDKLELECLSLMTFECAEHLAMQPFFHPAYPDNIPLKEAYQSVLGPAAQVSAVSENILSGLEESDLTLTAAYFHRLNFRALLARNAPEAYSALGQMIDDLSESGSDIELALVYIMHADQLCSPTTTSPLALNLVTIGTLTGYEVDFWDRSDFETSHRLLRNNEAMMYYESASDLLKTHECFRIKASVALRKACILHMQSLEDVRTKNAAGVLKNRHLASDQLQTARKFFEGDIAHLNLAKAHHVLLNITIGNRRNVITDAQKIGKSCKDHGTIQLARFIEILFLRFGRRQFLDNGVPGNVLLCFQCAQACARASGDPVYEHQADIAIAKLHCELSSIPEAQAALDSARKTLKRSDTGLKEVQDQAERGNLSEQAKSIENVRNNIGTYFERVRTAIDGRVSDPSTTIGSGEGEDQPASLNDQVGNEYRQAAENALAMLTGLRNDYTTALAEGNSALAACDFNAYTLRLEAFLSRLDNYYDDSERSVAIFKVMALCLVDRYEPARLALPSAISVDLGGTGQDKLFDAVTSAKLSTKFGDFKLSMNQQHEPKAMEQSIGICVWAEDWAQAALVLSKVTQKDSEYLKRLADERESGNWQAQAEVGAIYEHNNCLDQALRWYILSVRSMERFRAQTIDVEGRLASMSSLNSSELFAGLTRLSLRLHCAKLLSTLTPDPSHYHLVTGHWDLQALQFAEQGRARFLLDMLMLSSRESNAEAFKSWKQESFAFREYQDYKYNRRPVHRADAQEQDGGEPAKPSPHKSLDRPRSHYTKDNIESRWDAAYELLAKAEFHLDFTTTGASAFIAEDAMVLHCNVSTAESTIFAVTSNGVAQVKTCSLSRTKLRREVMRYQKMAQDSDSEVGFADLSLAQEVSDLLATHLVQPFQDIIDAKSHIIFVPSQELFAFPLCSLPYKDGTLILQKRCSTIPSLAILAQIAEKQRPIPPVTSSVFVHEDKAIYGTGFSAAMAFAAYKSPTSCTLETNEETFKKKFEAAKLIYFVTHGRSPASGSSPWQADIVLSGKNHHDRNLRVIDLANYKTNAAVVVFGACITAKGHTTLGNDVVGFSHAILESGAQCFIGALWEVSDWATMLMMLILHKTISNETDTKSIAQCLQEAQVHFYGLTNNKAVAFLCEAEREFQQLTESGKFESDENGWFQQCHECVLDVIDDMRNPKNVFDFQNPFYWAAWTVVGRGDVCLNGQTLKTQRESKLAKVDGFYVRHDEARRGSAPTGPQRPLATPLIRNDGQGTFVPLRAIHSVDSAGLPTVRPDEAQSPQAYRNMPAPPSLRTITPPPELPKRPNVLPAPPPHPPGNALEVPSPLHNYDPRDYEKPTSTRVHSTDSVIKRRPVSAAAPVASPSSPSVYTTNSLHSSGQVNAKRTFRSESRQSPSLEYDQVTRFAPPPSAAVSQPQMPARKQITAHSRTQPPAYQAIPNNRAQSRITHTQEKRPGHGPSSAGYPNSGAGQRVMVAATRPPGTPPIPGQVGFTGPPTAQPKRSPMDKVKKFAKSKTGRRAMRIGTTMLVASVTGGLVGAEAMDWGGGDVDVDGDFGASDFDGGDLGADDFGDAQFEDGYFEGTEYATDGAAFEDNVVMEAGGEDMYEAAPETYDDSTGGGAGGDIPGQIGPCFEDNVILSSITS